MVFPTLRSGAVCMYPSTVGTEYRTEIVEFVNDSEQRWPVRAGLGNFELSVTDVNGYDLSNIMDFFATAQGQKATNWTLTVNSITYNNCCFVQDDFIFTESKPNVYSLTLKCKQVF